MISLVDAVLNAHALLFEPVLELCSSPLKVCYDWICISLSAIRLKRQLTLNVRPTQQPMMNMDQEAGVQADVYLCL